MTPHRLTVRAIVAAAATVYGVSREALLLTAAPRGASNHPKLGSPMAIEARMVAVMIARHVAKRSWAQIATVIGYANHGSAVAAARTIATRLVHEDDLAARVAAVLAHLVLDQVRAPLPPVPGAGTSAASASSFH